MSVFRPLCLAAAMLVGVLALPAPTRAEGDNVLDHKVKTIDGETVDLAKFKGKVLLVVNVASRCGNTPQYDPLQTLHEKYEAKGLVVMGFPCNQFGKQEPGSEADIKEFCSTKYAVTFPMFSKVEVNGAGADPFYQELTSVGGEPVGKGPVKWNFEKFLIGRDGEVVARFGAKVKPDAPEVVAAIEKALAAK